MIRFLFLILLFSPAMLRAQADTEIYLFDLHFKNNKYSISNPVNITVHKGYDNQPFFHPVQPLIYYASANDSGRTDIKSYDYQKQITRQITYSEEREYSPTITPNDYYFSCIIQRDNGKQDLGMYFVGGGKPTILINTLKVGYHTWIDDNSLLLFVLADSTNNLHYYNLTTKENTIITPSPGRSLHKIPGKNTFSFIDKSEEQWLIKELDPIGMSTNTIIPTVGKSEDISWTPEGYMLTSDGEKLYACKPKSGAEWQLIDTKSIQMPGKVSRLAVNKAGTKLAVVVSE